VADHYQYMACIGPIALAAAGIEMGLGRIALDKRVLPLGLCAALLVTLGMLTWKQCRMYADNETLWQTTLRQNPRSVLAEVDLGTTAFKNGQVDKAIAYYQKALEINPRFSGVHYSLALTYFELGHFDEAVAQYKKEIEINPHNAAVRDNLGLALVANGKVDEAIAEFQKALAIQPNWAMAYDNLGSAFLKKGELDKAIANLQKGLQIGPSIASVQGNLGIAYAKKRQLAEALAHFKKAVENEPASAETCNNLAWLLATATDASVRNGPKALALAQSVLQMTGPDDPMALQTLGAAEAATGNFKEAVNIARRALELADRQKNQSLAGSLQQEIRLYKIGVPERDTLSRWIW
jgi:tetratricopeptide (TPR) repeat protein